VSSERREERPKSGDTPKIARPASGVGASLPKAIAVPPRDETAEAAGRWKVDPSMTPVAESESAAAPTSKRTSAAETPVEYDTTGDRRRLRGYLVPLGVCVIGLAVTIVVALVTQKQQKDKAEEREREAAAAKAAEPPPEPPPETSEVILAIRQGDHRVIKSLLDRKADPNKEANGTTPLLASVARGDAVAAKLLLAAGADANRTLVELPTPLIAAIEKLDVEMVTALLGGGGDPNLSDDRSGPPLVFAARKGNLPLIKLLLENKADVNSKSANGDTALMLAARQGKAELVAPLVEAGANLNAANEEKLTPLIYALDVARPDVVKLLLEKGADPLALRADGDGPLLIALTKNQLANYRLIDDAIGAAKQGLPSDPGAVPWKYLSELTPVEPAKAAKVPATMPKVKGIDTPHGIWLAPPEDKKPASIVYTLDRKFRFFQGFVAVPDTGAMKGEQAVTFRIVGDGKELWKSADIQTTGVFRNFRVDVSEVTKLELFVDCRAEAAGADAVWVEPKLIN
jgi:hypothetical protein